MILYLFCSFNSYHIRPPHILRCDNHYLTIAFFLITVVHHFKYFTCNPSEVLKVPSTGASPLLNKLYWNITF